MRDWQRIAAFALLAGVAVWVADAAIDATVLGRRPFSRELVPDVSTHEFYMRSVVCVSVALVVWHVLRHHQTSRALEHKDADTQLLMDKLDAFLWSATVSPAYEWDVRPLASRAFRRITGYEVEEIRRATGKTSEGIVLPEDLDEKDLARRRALAGECDEYYHEYRIRRKDGKVRWIGESARILGRSDDGMKVAGVCVDITERRIALEALRESEQKKLAILSAIPDLMFLNDSDGRYLEHYAASDAQLYVPPEEFLGKTITEVLPEHVAGPLLELTRRAVETRSLQSFEYDLEICGETGEYEARIVPCGAEKALTMVRDITERKRAREELREEEERFRRLSETGGQAVAIHCDGVLREANENFFTMFGYAREEVLGKQAAELLIAPEYTEEIRRRVRTGSTEHYRAVGIRKDGTRFPIEIHAAPVPYKGRTAHIGAIRDMTDQVRLEEQFRQAQKLEAVGRLADGVAHDFSNQLTVVKGYCHLLLHERDWNDSDHEALLEIRAAADRAARLTEQLLTFSRRKVIVPEVFNINHVLAQMRNPLARVIGEDVQLAIATEPDLGNVEADRSLLEQAVFNLAINARDAMPDGGRLLIETANVRLAESDVRGQDGAEPGAYVMLGISDTGKGIPEDVRRRIFEPFFTTKEIGGGTGLGLSMVYGFVRQSGGVIRVESKLGEGATFRLYLPRVFTALSVPAPPPESDGDIPTGSETVLVTEDEESVRHFMAKALRSCGYLVLETANAKEAVPLGEHYGGDIDLLVTDVVMPGTSGPELAKRLAAARPDLRVLYISGYPGKPESGKSALKLSENVLPKPFTPAMLARAVRAALGGSKRTKQE